MLFLSEIRYITNDWRDIASVPRFFLQEQVIRDVRLGMTDTRVLCIPTPGCRMYPDVRLELLVSAKETKSPLLFTLFRLLVCS